VTTQSTLIPPSPCLRMAGQSRLEATQWLQKSKHTVHRSGARGCVSCSRCAPCAACFEERCYVTSLVCWLGGQPRAGQAAKPAAASSSQQQPAVVSNSQQDCSLQRGAPHALQNFDPASWGAPHSPQNLAVPIGAIAGLVGGEAYGDCGG